jgi:bacterioferritin-associated ferredoxin
MKNLSCRDFNKQIPLYQEEALSTKELKAFIAHISDCADCQEELAIRYLVSDGLVRLEEGEAFDLQELMDAHMNKAVKQLKKRQTLHRLVYCFQALLVAALAIIIYLSVR